MAFGVKGWSLDDCITRFTQLCDPAFTPRELHTIWVLGKWAAVNYGSKYRTSPLHDALEKSLGDAYLFGGLKDGVDNYGTNVAVTATEELGKKAIILANYSRSEYRSELPPPDHEFLRPANPRNELRLWQAAAATPAAPTYFKPFHHVLGTGRSFIDGALYNNNPVKIAQKERRLLWPEVSKKHPDVLLSIGTGRDAETRKLCSNPSNTRER